MFSQKKSSISTSRLLPEVIPPFLKKIIFQTGGSSGPIGLQFISQTHKEKEFSDNNFDPLEEDKHQVLPGLVYKYRGHINPSGQITRFGRVLWTVTFSCTAYCRFCTRGREVGQNPNLFSDKQIDDVLKFIKHHKEINEVIVSGGDPLITPQKYLTKIIQGLSQLQKDGDIDIIRLGTRVPISNPILIQSWHFNLIKQLKNPYLMVHINHPAELTPESLDIFSKFKSVGATILSQTVLLKGVNDSVKTLTNLFNLMVKEGIRPYYLYQNDPVPWAKHFTVSLPRAIKIWDKLRPNLSGLAATARFVIDTPNGYGKVSLPEGAAWKTDFSSFKDFKGKKHLL